MKPMKRLLWILLALCLVLTCASCNGGGTGDDGTDSGEDGTPAESTGEAETDPVAQALSLIVNGESEYRTVYPENAGETMMQAVYEVRDGFEDYTGAKLSCTDDFVSHSIKENTYEILIGPTNREASQKCLSKLYFGEFMFTLDGTKLVICGSDDSATKKATNYFVRQVLRRRPDLEIGKTDGSFRFLESDYYKNESNYGIKTALIDGMPIDQFRIVIPSDADAENYIAALVSDHIKHKTGAILTVVTDSEPKQDCEILIGKTNRTTVTPKGDEYLIEVTEKCLQLTANTDFGLLEAYFILTEQIFTTSVNSVDLKLGYQLTGEEPIPEGMEHQGDLRILYHNVWGYSAAQYPVYDRADLMLAAYKAYTPEIIGWQEANNTHRKDAGLTVLESGYSRARSGDKGTTWVVFQREDGTIFGMTNSHFAADSNANNDNALGNQYRIQDAQNMLDAIKNIRAKYGDITIISGGDYNSVPSIGYFYVNGQMKGTLSQGAPIKQQDGTYLDVNGNATNSSGFLFDIAGNVVTFHAMYVFGGTYDGQDYKISNGTVKAPGTQNFDICYGSGLFGMIYGATIKNVKLDGITAQGTSCVGVLVGRAAVDGFGKNLDGSLSTDLVDVDFNQILDCSTSATCSVQSDYVTISNGYDQAGCIGGIAGMIGGTTIRNCVNNAAINVLGNINFAGGIVGVAGQGSAINKCVNNGLITCDVTTNANCAENAFGGIVGFIAPYATGIYSTNYLGGGLSITYCYNTGSFTFVGDKNTGVTYWGGILGGSSNPNGDGTYIIRDCYNLQNANVYTNSKNYNGTGYANSFRVGGLVGCAYQNMSGVGYLQLIDSYSVAPTGVKTTYLTLGGLGNSNNNSGGSSSTAGGAGYSTVVKVGNTTYTATATDAIRTACIKTEAQIKALLDAADITGAEKLQMPEELNALYAQKSTDGKSLRFIAAVKGTDWESVGMDIVASYTVDGTEIHSKRNRFACDVVFKTVYAENGVMTAPDGYYYAVVTITNVPTDKGDVVFRVMPYAKDASGTVNAMTLGYLYRNESTDLSALTLGGNAISSASVTYDTSAGSVNVAEMLQMYLNDKGAMITLGDTNATNTIHFTVDTTLTAATWKITTTAQNITVTADTAYGLIAAYEFMLPRIGLADPELTDTVKSASGTYQNLAEKTGDVRILYQNILSYTIGLSVAERADLMLLTYKAYLPDVLCLQEASASRFWIDSATDALDAWLSENYTEVTLYTSVGIGNPIFIRNGSGLTVKDKGYEVSRGDKGTGWVVLEKDGKTFAVTNSHFEANSNANDVSTVGDEYRRNSAAKLVEIVNTIQSSYGCPVITGGDYNSQLYSEAGMIMTYGGSYKSLVKYSSLSDKTGYTSDSNGYAMRDGSYVYAETFTNYEGGLTAVRHLAAVCPAFAPSHGVTYNSEAGRYQTVVSLNARTKNAIDHILYRAGETTVTFEAYCVIDDCFALTSSDHAPHYVDITLN